MTAPQTPYIPTNVPSAPKTEGAATGRNQRDRRYIATFFDVHRNAKRFPNGRPWTGWREIAANRDTNPMVQDGFCSGLEQGHAIFDENTGTQQDRAATWGARWFAPWVPYEKYFKIDYRRERITFAYQQMWADEDRGLREYYKAASDLGIQLNLRVEPGVIPHPQIVHKLGEPSRMILIAQAAMAGDPWLLGFIDEPNPTLAEILNYNQRGLPMFGAAPMGRPAVVETPDGVPQRDAIQAVLTAGPNADMMAILAKLAADAAAQAVTAALDAREQQQADKKAQHGAKVKAGMARKAQQHSQSSQSSQSSQKPAESAA